MTSHVHVWMKHERARHMHPPTQMYIAKSVSMLTSSVDPRLRTITADWRLAVQLSWIPSCVMPFNVCLIAQKNSMHDFV